MLRTYEFRLLAICCVFTICIYIVVGIRNSPTALTLLAKTHQKCRSNASRDSLEHTHLPPHSHIGRASLEVGHFALILAHSVWSASSSSGAMSSARGRGGSSLTRPSGARSQCLTTRDSSSSSAHAQNFSTYSLTPAASYLWPYRHRHQSPLPLQSGPEKFHGAYFWAVGRGSFGSIPVLIRQVGDLWNSLPIHGLNNAYQFWLRRTPNVFGKRLPSNLHPMLVKASCSFREFALLPF